MVKLNYLLVKAISFFWKGTKMKFRLLPKTGEHVEQNVKGNDVVYKPGDIIESDIDLRKKFPNKFEFVEGSLIQPEAGSPDIPLQNIDPDAKSKEVKPAAKTESPFGKDVSVEFPLADRVHLKVFVKSNWFTIVDPVDEIVQNEKKLRRDAVLSFLSEYEEDSDNAEVN